MTQETTKVDVREYPVAAISELEGNPNQMSDAEFNSLCEEIAAGSPIPPILIGKLPDGKLVAIDGNHRLRAAKLTGYETIPGFTVAIDSVSLAQVLATKYNLVRGTINRGRFTKIWYQLRQQVDERNAMRALGVTSEQMLSKLLISTKRKVDAKTVVDEEVQILLRRAGTVNDLVNIVRAAIGDGGVGEFDYMVFQVRGSEIALVRVPQGEMDQLVQLLERAEEIGVARWRIVVDGMKHVLGEQTGGIVVSEGE